MAARLSTSPSSHDTGDIYLRNVNAIKSLLPSPMGLILRGRFDLRPGRRGHATETLARVCAGQNIIRAHAFRRISHFDDALYNQAYASQNVWKSSSSSGSQSSEYPRNCIETTLGGMTSSNATRTRLFIEKDVYSGKDR